MKYVKTRLNSIPPCSTESVAWMIDPFVSERKEYIRRAQRVPYCYFEDQNVQERERTDFLCYRAADGDYAIVKFSYCEVGRIRDDLASSQWFNVDDDGVVEDLGFSFWKGLQRHIGMTRLISS